MNTNGIGLGLVISDMIVNQFNGKISFESKEDQGSTFTFTFKLKEAKINNEDSVPIIISNIDNYFARRESVPKIQSKYQINSPILVFEWEAECQNSKQSVKSLDSIESDTVTEELTYDNMIPNI